MAEKHDPRKTLGPVVQKSEDEFNEGLKVLLEKHTSGQMDALARWPGELTDPDFAKTKDTLSRSLAEKNQRLLNELRERFAKEQLDLDAIVKDNK